MKLASTVIEGLRHAAAPGWRAKVVASFIGLLFRIVSPRKKTALENLSIAFPDKTTDEKRRILHEMYSHLSWMITEQLVLQRDPAQSLQWIDEIEGEEYVDELLSQGRGAVLLTAHFGNWELFVAWGIQRSYPLTAVVRGPSDPDIDKLLYRYRANCGAEIFDRRDKSLSTIGLVKMLKKGRLLAIAGDVNEYGGIRVPFFGRDCMTPAGAATFALLADVPVLPFFIYRKGPFSHKAVIGKPIKMPTYGSRDEKIEIMTRDMNLYIEQVIKKNPALWFWLHKRWKL